MKFKTYNSSTANSRSGSVAMVYVGHKGAFSINEKACSDLGLKEGQGVVMHQDEERPSDWYLEQTDEGGIPLRKPKTGGTLFFQNQSLCTDIIKSLDSHIEKGSLKIRIATEPIEVSVGRNVFAILTRSIKP